MSQAILCIGSNMPDASDMICHAVNLISTYGCSLVKSSDVYQTSSPYLNLVVSMSTQLDYEHLLTLTKVIERTLGRTPQMKTLNIVPVDIDIVMYDDCIVRPSDYNAPYFTIGYRKLISL